MTIRQLIELLESAEEHAGSDAHVSLVVSVRESGRYTRLIADAAPIFAASSKECNDVSNPATLGEEATGSVCLDVFIP